MTATPTHTGWTAETTDFEPFVDGLMSGYYWSLSGSRVITYSFQDDQYDVLDVTNNQNDWQQWEMDAAHLAFSWIEAVIDVDFEYVGLNSTSANFDLHNYNEWWSGWPDNAAAFAYFPETGSVVAGDSYFMRQEWTEDSIQVGGFGFQTLVHELIHNLGLQHPFDDNAHPSGDPSPNFDDNFGWSHYDALGVGSLENQSFTTMSYTIEQDWNSWSTRSDDWASYGQSAGPMAADILALQYLYGANTSSGVGDTVYTLPSGNGSGTYYECIWDVGGTDTISAAGLWGDAYINLNPGFLISAVDGIYGGFTIAYDLQDGWHNAGSVECWIENAVGGFGNDGLIGNDRANVLSGDLGNDTLVGGNGNDSLEGGGGNDRLEGDAGDDEARGGAGNDLILDDDGNDTLWGDDGADTLVSGAGADSIDAGAGNDVVGGGNDNDLLLAGSGDDTVYGQHGDDHLEGDEGHDTLYGGTGHDTLSGGEGNDTLQGDGAQDDSSTGLLDETTGGSDSVLGGGGNDTILGGAGNDFLDGESGDDALLGGEGDDTLYGGSNDNDVLVGGNGNDSLDGGSGNDTLIGDAGDDTLIGGDGADTLTGGAGNDTYHYYGHEEIHESGADTADEVLLWAGRATGIEGIEVYRIQEYAGDLVATGLDTVNDALYGNEGHNGLYGKAGDDSLYGGDGDDYLDGGAGADFIVGGEGDDTYVFDGLDVIWDDGSGVNDTVETTVDIFSMLLGTEHVTALGAADLTLTGNEYNNILTGNGGANTIVGRDGSDTIDGKDGNDTLRGDGGGDLIMGAAGDDDIVGGLEDDSDGADTIDGGAGDDEIRGGARGDVLRGGDDHDTLYGGSGWDNLSGGDGNDALYGGDDGDYIQGGLGNDLIEGGTGSNSLEGQGGHDTIIAGGDSDYVDGGDGIDRLIIDMTSSTGDVYTSDTAPSRAFQESGGRYISFMNIEQIVLSTGSGNDWIRTEGTDDTLNGGAGNDTLESGAGIDVIDGGDGADLWLADLSGVAEAIIIDLNDTTTTLPGARSATNVEALEIKTGSGNDVITTLAGDYRDYIETGAGDDTIVLAGGFDYVFAGAGYDTVVVELGHLTEGIQVSGPAVFLPNAPDGESRQISLTDVERLKVVAGSGDDWLWGSDWTLSSDDEFHGNGGHDSLYGWKGSDTLFGGAGNDVLNGGEGNDTLDGGADNDLANLDGYRSDYTITGQSDGTITVTDTVGTGGTDILRNIERFQFLDGTFTFDQLFAPSDPNLDMGAPEIMGVTIPQTVDLADGHTQVTFTVAAIDAKSGVDAVILRLDQALTFVYPGGVTETTDTIVVTDGWTSGTGEASVSGVLSSLTQSGTYSIVGATVIDNAGNTRDYSALALANLGQPMSITITGGGHLVNHNPTGITLVGSTVAENSATGTLVGGFLTADQDLYDGHTYTLLNDAGGRFKLVGNHLVVASGALLDYETATSHAITVRTTDSGGATFDQTFTIGVGNLPETPPTVTTTKSYVLPADGLNIVATGSSSISLTGNANNNSITGNAGKNKINGGLGNDKLKGGLGIDELIGGKGKDVFIFDTKPSSTNIDKISDYSVADDTIWLDNKYLTKVGAGTLTKALVLSKKAFWIGPKAHDKDDRIIYDNKTGALYYDADGTGVAAQIKIAQLAKGLKMTYADFYVI